MIATPQIGPMTAPAIAAPETPFEVGCGVGGDVAGTSGWLLLAEGDVIMPLLEVGVVTEGVAAETLVR